MRAMMMTELGVDFPWPPWPRMQRRIWQSCSKCTRHRYMADMAASAPGRKMLLTRSEVLDMTDIYLLPYHSPQFQFTMVEQNMHLVQRRTNASSIWMRSGGTCAVPFLLFWRMYFDALQQRISEIRPLSDFDGFDAFAIHAKEFHQCVIFDECHAIRCPM
jgi:hypothetical protein